jgi:hypothetical protein
MLVHDAASVLRCRHVGGCAVFYPTMRPALCIAVLFQSILGLSASLTWRSEIVNLDKVQSSPMIQFTLHSMGH